MGTLYIGGYKSTKKSGFKFKVYMYLFLFFAFLGSSFKLAGPTIVEKWINGKGTGSAGYAFSVRDVELSLMKGQVRFHDVKVFNPKTANELIEAPDLTITVSWSDLIRSQKKNLTVSAEKLDLIVSSDLSSEMERIKDSNKNDVYLDMVDAKIGKLSIIEKKASVSRTMLELKEVNVKLKEVGLLSINKKTEFTVSSNIVDGGKLNLTGKTSGENSSVPWSIQGSLKQVPSDIFNKIAGDKLPFVFHESHLNAEINALSHDGKVTGEIAPEIKKVNLLNEKPGVAAQSIKRMLTDELTFVLPFTLKDHLSLEYDDTYRKLKTYRRFPASIAGPETAKPKVSQAEKSKKSFSFWPW